MGQRFKKVKFYPDTLSSNRRNDKHRYEREHAKCLHDENYAARAVKRFYRALRAVGGVGGVGRIGCIGEHSLEQPKCGKGAGEGGKDAVSASGASGSIRLNSQSAAKGRGSAAKGRENAAKMR